MKRQYALTDQGLAVGGEWAGAMLMAGEHSTARSKGMGATLAMAGAPFGAVMATLVGAGRRCDLSHWSRPPRRVSG